MTLVGLLSLAVILSACSDPALSAGLKLTEDGLVFRPAASSGLGSLSLTVEP